MGDSGIGREDLSIFGLIVMVVGSLVFIIGTRLSIDWFVQNRYVLNVPGAILVTFVVVGLIFIFGSKRTKSEQ